MNKVEDFIDYLERCGLMTPALTEARENFVRAETLKRENSGIIPFGKFKGMKMIDVVAQRDGTKYLAWLVKQSWFEKFPELSKEASYYADKVR